ncbi:hypothetical protein GSI_15022 [Ganoderma sinense ZZ0214-1]|uniref:Uncharacterized protein n=1 Tax=Ganoderma sinense ZZ0214-1 TaxID=1077348 RepID=A0A2G8RLD5_9APHY|nr:hypothetical protein GSI_15022 [Ganoderma sinense ZZ0214-1]
MPVNVGDTHGNGALPVPRASTDGGSTLSVAPSTVQGASPQSWATTDSTMLSEGDKEAQLLYLSDQLKVENRIKEGAENLLRMSLTVSTRGWDLCDYTTILCYQAFAFRFSGHF